MEQKFFCPVFPYLTLGPAACMNTNCYRLNRCSATQMIKDWEYEFIHGERGQKPPKGILSAD